VILKSDWISSILMPQSYAEDQSRADLLNYGRAIAAGDSAQTARLREAEHSASDQRRDEPCIISSILIYGIFSWPGLGFVGAGLNIARYIGAIAIIWVLMIGFNPALRISLNKPLKNTYWEVMGIGIPASIERCCSTAEAADADVCRRDGDQRYRR
jgi:hypothetical protein